METLKNIFKQMKTWQKYAIGIGLFLIITLASFIYTMPDGYKPIYENLSETDRQKILVEFSKRGVDYKIDETGAIISVKSQDESWVRTAMNEIGLPSGDKKGYEMFGQASMGATQKDKELNELAGRKGQIENELVTNFSIIETATVNFNLPKKTSIFEDSKEPGTASVMISMRQGATITAEQIMGIQYMVSSAIPGVETQDVTIIDSEKGVISSGVEGGQTLSTAYEKQMEIKRKTEQNIHDDIKRTLSSLLGYENVQINVNAAINFDEIVRNIEQYDDQGVLRSKNGEKENTIKVDGEKAPEAGLDSNGDVPQYDVNSGDGTVRYQQAKENIIENFEIGKTVETIKKSPELTNTNVLVIVDKAIMQEQGINAEQLREAIGIAAGMTYNPETTLFTNGQVSVLEGTFEKAPVVKEKTKQKDEGFLKDNMIFIIIGGAVLILLVGILLFLASRKRKKEKMEAEVAEQASLVAEQSQKNSLLTVGDNHDDDDDDDVELESPKDKEKRLKKEKRQLETSEEVKKLSGEFPRETADYLKKLMNQR